MASSYNESSNGATSVNGYATMDETSTFTGFVNNNKNNSFFVIPVSYNDLVSFSLKAERAAVVAPRRLNSKE
jgi:hypothetical protein